MKNILIIAILVIASYFAWQKMFRGEPIEALYEEPYIVVYGRDSCGWTQKFLKDLEARGIEFSFESVDSRAVCDELHPRMKAAGLDTRRYNLPVIDVNAHMFIRPEVDDVLAVFENSV
jgi:hypothetical protein